MSSKLRKLALELSGEKQKRRQANKVKKMIRQHKHHKHHGAVHKMVENPVLEKNVELSEVSQNTVATPELLDKNPSFPAEQEQS